MIYWFTGQPCAGKTILADMLKKDYLPHAFRIDGDEMRELFTNKDYSIKGRVENVGTAQRIAHYLHNQGHDVIVSLVSPYIDQREDFKNLLGDDIKEIYPIMLEESKKLRAKIKQNKDNYSWKLYECETEECKIKLVKQFLKQLFNLEL